MNKEDFFINQFDLSPKLKDDGAYLDGFVYSKDAFFEGVHFKKEWLSLEQIGYKAMLVNISDAIVMNAHPLYALLAVAIPKSYTVTQLQDLANGFKKAADAYGIAIIGGDTIANSKLDITVTLISKTTKPVFRRGLKNGDLLFHTGTLGESQKNLNTLQRGFKLATNSRFAQPMLRDKFFYAIAPLVRVALDISDGLDTELARLSKINHLTIKRKPKKSTDCSGEEYEILFGISPSKVSKIKALAKRFKVPLVYVGKASRGGYQKRCKSHHF